jgi:putative phosphonate metabolism protein
VSESRCAIYFAPEDDSALARFGWPWLGRRPETVDDAPFLSAVSGDSDHTARVADPRLYGLHATLKPPFHLASGTTRDQLVDTLRALCKTRAPIEAPPLTLAEIGDFIALRPASNAKIDRLAADCVTAFDRFRAPSTPEDIAKRANGLTPRQHEHLKRWGYPYVLDEFRFHVTLSGRLADDERARTRAQLMPLLGDVLAEPLRIASLCLFEQANRTARFTLAMRIPFGT